MAIWESINSKFCFVLEGSRRLQFQPGPDRIERQDGSAKSANSKLAIGVLDSASAVIQQASGMKEAEIDALIQGSSEFRDHGVGEIGIWKREERVAAAGNKGKQVAFQALMEEMDDANLRQFLLGAPFKLSLPMNASKAQLIELGMKARYGSAKEEQPSEPMAPAPPDAPATNDPAAVRIVKKK